MKIYQKNLSDTDKYIKNHLKFSLEDKEPQYEYFINLIEKYKKVSSTTKILEIGTGTGWFPILCKKNGIECKGIEISPQLIDFAKKLGNSNNISPDIELGNIEEPIGFSKYDVILATSVFEHVEFWEKGIKNAYDALKPGGLLIFNSTNKFALKSGEYPYLPLYGWLPDVLRYKIRIYFQDKDIMKLGIDFNQFTFFKLRKFFFNVGFSEVYDVLDFSPITEINYFESLVLNSCKKNYILKNLLLFFFPVTSFICIK